MRGRDDTEIRAFVETSLGELVQGPHGLEWSTEGLTRMHKSFALLQKGEKLRPATIEVFTVAEFLEWDVKQPRAAQQLRELGKTSLTLWNNDVARRRQTRRSAARLIGAEARPATRQTSDVEAVSLLNLRSKSFP